MPAADHDRELAFWQGAGGEPLAQMDRHPEYHAAALPGQEQMPSWQVLRDLAGLLFCVVPDPPGTLNDDNAKRWD